MNEISEVIRDDLVITEENVAELTEIAEMYSCFEKVSRILTNKCVGFYSSMNKEDNVDLERNNVGESRGSLEEGEEGETVKQYEEVSQSDREDQEDSGQDSSISCREIDSLTEG